MRTLLIFILFLFLSSCITAQGPFSGRTKHKPIKRMTRTEWIKAESGHTLYVRENGKVYRNTGRQWTRFKKPTYKHKRK